MKTEVELNSANEDVKSANACWYDGDDVFIEQVETGTGIKHLLMFGREGVPSLIAALQQFLSSVPTP